MLGQTIKTVGQLLSTSSNLISTGVGAINCGLETINDEIKSLHLTEPNQNRLDGNQTKPILRVSRRLDQNQQTNQYSWITNSNGYISIGTYQTDIPYTNSNHQLVGKGLTDIRTLKQSYNILMNNYPEHFVVYINNEPVVLWENVKEYKQDIVKFVHHLFNLI